MRTLIRVLILFVLSSLGMSQRSLAAEVQCYGTVQSVVANTNGIIDVSLVPTPPATTQPCPAPCNPDPATGWTYLAMAAAAPGKDQVYAAALVALASGKPVYVAANTSFLPGSTNCQIDVFQVKAQ